MRKKEKGSDDAGLVESMGHPESNLKSDEVNEDVCQEGGDAFFDDDMFTFFPEGTRIFIEGNTVMFENMTPDLEEVARSLNPDSCQGDGVKKRRKSRKKS